MNVLWGGGRWEGGWGDKYMSVLYIDGIEQMIIVKKALNIKYNQKLDKKKEF